MKFSDFINNYLEKNNLSYREMGELCNVSHTEIGRLAKGKKPTVKTIEKIAKGSKYSKNELMKLAGFIEKEDYEQNSNKLPPNAIPVNEETTTLIPVLGRVACGEPLLAESNIIGYRLVLKKTINGGTYFFLQAEGDSMINAGIVPGSFILIREQEEVENGEIAVVCFMDGFDAEATVKRIHRTDGKLVLQPESPNPQHKVQIVDRGRVEIIGKVVGIQTDL